MKRRRAIALLVLAAVFAVAWWLTRPDPRVEPGPSGSSSSGAPAGESAGAPGSNLAPGAAPARAAEGGASSAAAPVAPVEPAPAVAPTSAVPGRIFGRVLRPDGQPAAGRAVRILRTPGGPIKNAIADADGRYDQRELPAAKYHVSSQPDDKELASLELKSRISGLEWLAQTSVVLAAGAEVEVNLGQPPARPIRVHGVLTGAPEMPDAMLQWVPEGDDGYNRARYVSTREGARYSIELSEPGTYRLSIVTEGPTGGTRVDQRIEVPEQPEFRCDVALPTGQVRLRVVDETGAAVTTATVDLAPRAGVMPVPFMSASVFSRSVDKQGRLTWRWLSPGTWSVAVHGAKRGDEKLCAQRRTIEVAAGAEPEELLFTLAPGLVARGRIEAADGGPLATANVFVFDAEGEPLNPLFGARVDKSGGFELHALPPGRYALIAAAGDRWSASVPLELAADVAPPETRLVLRPAGRLRVERGGDEPAWIDVRDARGNCLSALLDRNLYTGGYGRANHTRAWSWYLPEGNYEVCARGATRVVATQRVPVAAGEVARVLLD